MRNLKRRLPIVVFVGGMVLVLVVLTVLAALNTPVVDARALLDQASSTSLVPADRNQVAHWRGTVYQRTNPKAVEPPDLYHQPILNQYSDTYLTETWVRGGQPPQSRSTTKDARSGRLIYDSVYDGERYGYYSDFLGYASSSPSKAPSGNTTALPFPDPAQFTNLKTAGTKVSTWGKPAWVVQAIHSSPSPTDLAQTANQPLYSQRPYALDLNLTGEEVTWLIDQDSHFLVSFERKGLTTAGPILLERIERSQPEILDANVLPNDWLAFPPPNAPVLEANRTPPAAPMLSSLPEVIKAADFSIFVPDTTNSGLTQSIVEFKPQVEPQEAWQQKWRFDIQSAAGHGLALQIVYLPAKPDGHALVVIEGPSQRLVPLMKGMRPTWTQSRSVTLKIEVQTTTAWIATGGTIDNPPKRLFVMLEVQNTFIFMVGQNYSEEQLLNFASTLHRIP